MFTFFMKHVKFQVPRQSQCEPGPGLADRERGGESAETSRQRRVLPDTPTLQHSTSSRTTTRTVIRMLLMQDRVLGETVGD